MSSPGTQRSTYRERRINAMLQEASVETPLKSLASPATIPAKMVGPTSPLGRRLTKSVLLTGLLTALLCAAAVFFLLFRRDAAHLSNSVPSQPVHAVAATPKAMQAATPTVAQSTPRAPVRSTFKLRRSKYFQTIGAYNLKLVSSNSRRGTCSLSIAAVSGTRPHTSTVQLNRPFELPGEDGTGATLLVDEIGKDSVAGHVTTRQ